jgi:aspartokinase
MAVRKNLALLKIKTAELEETPGVISRLAQALNKRGINIYGLFTVASGIHVFVDATCSEEALLVIKESVKELLEVDSLECYALRR